MELSWIDIGIVVIFLLSITVAVLRGFVREVFSLGTWVAAVWLAVTFCDRVALLLPAGMDDPDTGMPGAGQLRTISAFLLILVGTWVVGTLLNVAVGKVVDMSGPRILDRVLALFFGLVRGSAVVVLVVLVASFTSFSHFEVWNSSRLLPYFELAARRVVEAMPAKYSEYFPYDETESQPSL